MKTDVNPIIIGVVLVAVLAAVGYFGVRAMQPASYTPSPGVTSNDGSAPGTTEGIPALSPGEKAYQDSLRTGGLTPGIPDAPAAASADSGSPIAGPQGQIHVAPD